MALNMNKNLKLYYSIGEVAKMFDINESTLSLLGKRVSSSQTQDKTARTLDNIQRKISNKLK